MGIENDTDLLEQFTKIVSADSNSSLEKGTVHLHVMPDRIIAQVRSQIAGLIIQKNSVKNRINELKSKIFYHDQTIQEMNAERLALLRKRKEEFQRKIDLSPINTSYSVPRNTEETAQLNIANNEYPRLFQLLGILKTELLNYNLAVTKKANCETELSELPQEIERLDIKIQQYEDLIIQILEASIQR